MTTPAQNTKISPNFPVRKSPGIHTVSADPWANRPKNLQRRRTKKTKHQQQQKNVLILRNEQIQNVYKNQKIQNIYKFFIFSSDILQEVDVNQMKPT